MQLFIKKKIGKETYTFTVEGKNLHECVMESQKLSFGDIHNCGKCGKDNLILNARVAQGFKYTEIKCLSCKAQLVFGTPKAEVDTSYLRKDKKTKEYAWQEYTPETDTQSNPE